MVESPYLTLEEASTALRMTKQTVLNRIHAGEIPYKKVGRKYLVPRSYVMDTSNEEQKTDP